MDWEYNKMNDNREEPTIVQMTLKAIELLSTNPNGFYLLVEGFLMLIILFERNPTQSF